MRRWWRGFLVWFDAAAVSLAVIPLPSGPVRAVRKIRKSLRDARDRAARQDNRFKRVAFAGLASEGNVLVLIHHPGVSRQRVWTPLQRRWPEIILTDPGRMEPSSLMIAADAAALARCRRGIEPLRIVVPRQRVSVDEGDQPMPFRILEAGVPNQRC